MLQCVVLCCSALLCFNGLTCVVVCGIQLSCVDISFNVLFCCRVL